MVLPGLIVHEWIAERGGSEQVLEAVAGAFPTADILCLWNDSSSIYPPKRVRETWLSKTPLRRAKALALPLMLPTWRMQRTNSYDWAFVSSHLFAHHVKVSSPETPKYVYAHTPARYIWTPELDERGNNAAVRLISKPLKALDKHRAQEPLAIAANSEFVQKRIQETWGRDSIVIYPPVDVAELTAVADWSSTLDDVDIKRLENLPDTFILGASRFVPYKRVDIAIDAGEAAQVPVVLAGAGPELEELRARAASASVPVTIIENPSNALLRHLFQSALLYVFPPVEDFGIMPVEAMALGTPVLANAVGGASESVIDGRTGALVNRFDGRELRNAIDRAASATWEDCVSRAKLFSKERFQNDVRTWIGEPK